MRLNGIKAARALARRYPGREYTVNGMRSMRVWWTIARQCIAQVKSNWPELYQHIKEQAEQSQRQ